MSEAEDTVVDVASDRDVVAARQAGRAIAEELGMSSTDLTLVATAISEVARNILLYAGSGRIRIRLVHAGTRRGVEVVAEDEGPGIEDVDKAMRDGWSSGQGLGLGLPGARRLMDEFDLRSKPGRGTKVTMTKWARAG